MLEIIGIAAGVGLGMGAAGKHGQHWAVRVLCAIGGGAAAVGWVVAMLVGGVKDNGYADAMWGALMGFSLSSLVGGAAWLMRGCAAAVPWLKANPGKIAVVIIGAAAIAAAAGRLAKEQAGEVQAVEARAGEAQAGEAQAVEARAGEAQAVEAQAWEARAAQGCECSAGAVCIGPRGGRYCLTAAGNKKYL